MCQLRLCWQAGRAASKFGKTRRTEAVAKRHIGVAHVMRSSGVRRLACCTLCGAHWKVCARHLVRLALLASAAVLPNLQQCLQQLLCQLAKSHNRRTLSRAPLPQSHSVSSILRRFRCLARQVECLLYQNKKFVDTVLARTTVLVHRVKCLRREGGGGGGVQL